MPALSPTCPLCSHPMLVGAYSMLNHGDGAHQVPGISVLVNRWPEGIRQLLCLNCSRVFPSNRRCSASAGYAGRE